MFSNSVIISSIYRFLMLLRLRYSESRTASILRGMARSIRNAFSSSRIVQVLLRDGYLERVWENSFVYGLLEGLLNLPAVLHKLYVKAEPVLAGSFIFRLILLAAEKLHIVLSAFLFLVLIVPYGRWSNIYSTIGAIGFLLLYCLRLAAGGEKFKGLKYFNVFFILFAGCIILSEFTSIFPGDSLRFFIFYLTCFVLMLLLAASIRTAEELYTSIGIILLGLGICGLYGVYQSIKGVPVIASQIDSNLNEGTPGRVFSTFSNTNNFAQVLCMLLPLCIAMLLNAKYAISRLFFAGLAIPAFVSLFYTSSRSGWIGFAFSIVVFVFLVNKKFFPAIIVLGLLSIPLMPDFVYKRLTTVTNLQDTSISYRFKIWDIVYQMLGDYWTTGIGTGTDVFRKVVQNYYLGFVNNATPPHSHNLFLHIWLETGIVGIFAFVAFLARLFKDSWLSIAASTDKRLRRVLAACVSSLASLAVIGLFEYPWYEARVMIVFWVVVALAASALALMHREGKENRA